MADYVAFLNCGQKQSACAARILQFEFRDMKADVQIVHAGSTADREAAIRIADELRSNGIDVWLDLDTLVNGFTPISSVETAIRNCRVCLFIWSRDAADMDFVGESVVMESAAERHMRTLARKYPAVILIDIDDTIPFSPYLARSRRFRVRLDLWLRKTSYVKEFMDELLKEIRSHLTKRKVFISHSSRDKEKVLKIVNRLKQEDYIDLWYDDDSLKAGAIIRRGIESGIASADYLIVVLSNNAIDTIDGWIGFELDQAYEIERERNKHGHYFAIPILLEPGLDIPGWLATKLYIDLAKDFDLGMRRLGDAIRVDPALGPS